LKLCGIINSFNRKQNKNPRHLELSRHNVTYCSSGQTNHWWSGS